ncbi:substrate-binding domain-containing protein [Bordetella sp. N]|uniref:substrate-binding domain-containing protein n=1 Tax=Bordetella sp. N TaxID=1746199 RepID=UPI000ABF884E|nr:substrate-binding domain-containing protein [Bordetella sp. N]
MVKARQGRSLQLRVFVAVLLAAGSAAAQAQDSLKILTAGAIKSVVTATVPAFRKDAGREISIENDTAGALVKRLEGGDACDLTLLPAGALKELAAKGIIDGESIRPIARVGIGVVVASGTARPDIATVDAFKAALLAAPSVAYLDPAAGGSSGVYLTGLFKKLGIDQQIAAKAVLVPGGLVAQKIVDGQAALGIHQISEILTVPGAVLVGPLPAEIQNYTNYAAAVCAKSASKTAAAVFINELHTPATQQLLKTKGMEPAN